MARGLIQRDEMQAADVASILRKVQMPSVQHLLSASLEPTRAAICAASPERDPQHWIVLHMILGTALRLRAPQMPLHERTQACVEAVRAFECALAECCERKTSRQLRRARIGTNQFSLQVSACASGPDGVQMVMDATTVPMGEGIEMLERAICMLQDAADRADRRTELPEWVVARSNLGCALTLLGQRTYGMDGVQRIERAIDVLREAAAACTGNELLQERASVYVNLSEAFQALAERGMPGERICYVERSLDWMSAALGFFAPQEYQWLLQMDRAAFA
jgi:hypothetical protein